MMREIKFRVWIKPYMSWTKCIVPGHLVKVHSIHMGTKKVIVTADGSGNRSLNYDDIFLDQFTGMVDKNGVDIYEGDIVEAWSQGVKATGEIRQRMDGLWLIYPAWQSGAFWGLMPSDDGRTTVEIIGNIHERGDTNA